MAVQNVQEKEDLIEETAFGATRKQLDQVDVDFDRMKELEGKLEKGTRKFLDTNFFPPKGKNISDKSFDDWRNFVLLLNGLFRASKTTNPSKLAKAMKIKPPSVYAALAKGIIPEKWVFRVAQEHKLSIDEITSYDLVDTHIEEMDERDSLMEEKNERVRTVGKFDKMLKVIEKHDIDEHDLLVGRIHRLYNKYK